ncbi:MAG: HipA domain-containing protein [Candidatus Magnetoglobus multicellularis str. Araruama]|uniref:HipA domain-containing protein n=1 Tax=Candidatus Magnetoglobus multicellularis str. Araruama TaxID=890399 RepID=A0A1V1NZD6_9BACT|nr:MAG: HipA domain-containing protein [Candidatus Magnetoglobus multicellularis str. Araruama]
MEKSVLVYCTLENVNHFVGRLWTHASKGRQSATFEYTSHWIDYENAFALEPALPLVRGSFHTEPGLLMFRSFADTAPDRWGRMLMQRRERKDAKNNNRTPKTLLESDYLLQVNDTARHGALRFSDTEEKYFLSSDDKNPIPPLIQLQKLLSASNRIQKNTENDNDIHLLISPGASLGGARPKANVIGNNKELMIAKFPFHLDDYDMQKWEAIALTLAKQSGINVPPFQIMPVENQSVLLISRFDRKKNERIPFVSALTMLGAKDNEQRSYLEIADVIRSSGSSSKMDLKELFTRIIFSIHISNVDDHLRNHGFLRNPNGWRLSPVYDLNPTPVDIKERILSTCIDFDNPIASIDIAFDVCEYFDLNITQARKITQKNRCNCKKIGEKLHQA